MIEGWLVDFIIFLVVDAAVADRDGEVEPSGVCLLPDAEKLRAIGGGVLEFHLDANRSVEGAVEVRGLFFVCHYEVVRAGPGDLSETAAEQF